MGDKTKIDWADATWNPVTGCKHGCEYCYARGIAQRFGCKIKGDMGNALAVLEEPYRRAIDGKINPYPYEFLPTFHEYRLSIPQNWTKPRNIFVCSMADLFGEWVPDEWIKAVFDACAAAPWHRYLFLTKNPMRYAMLAGSGELPESENMWYGQTVTGAEREWVFFNSLEHKTFLSIEPLLAPITLGEMGWSTDWIIIGAETGNRKGKVRPGCGWVNDIACECRGWSNKHAYIPAKPVFMKESLREIMGPDFRQEFPWEVE